jgi:hypothetical protein
MFHPIRVCVKCNRERLPEGGVEIKPGRWYCHACWHIFTQRKSS